MTTTIVVNKLKPVLGLEHKPDFVDPRQRVHDDHLALGASHEVRRDDMLPGGALIFRLAREALALDARHVEDVRVRQSLIQTRKVCLKSSTRCKRVSCFRNRGCRYPPHVRFENSFHLFLTRATLFERKAFLLLTICMVLYPPVYETHFLSQN